MKWKTDGFGIRIFAMAAMASDHTAVVFSNILSESCYMAMRCFGRCAFVLFAFLTAEGAAHTKSRERYMLRLFALAALSEPFFDVALHNGFTRHSQNTVFTLLLGVLAIELAERFKSSAPQAFACCAVCAVAAQLFKSDCGALGVITVLLFYFGASAGLRPAAVAVLFSVAGVFGEDGALYYNSLFALVALLLLVSYNGRQGRRFAAAFYLFYPLHLVFILAARFAYVSIRNGNLF